MEVGAEEPFSGGKVPLLPTALAAGAVDALLMLEEAGAGEALARGRLLGAGEYAPELRLGWPHAFGGRLCMNRSNQYMVHIHGDRARVPARLALGLVLPALLLLTGGVGHDGWWVQAA